MNLLNYLGFDTLIFHFCRKEGIAVVALRDFHYYFIKIKKKKKLLHLAIFFV